MSRITASDPALITRIRSVIHRLGANGAVDFIAADEGPLAVDGATLPGYDERSPEPDPDWFIEALVLRALAPKHMLFLCVANSARSQLGEGIGRLLAPSGVKISSAGSEPTRVRPQAIAVMREMGVDITTHTSKGMDDVERPVDTVITLCAEESCPAWLEAAWRVHWPLPDPAGAGSNDEEEMDAFRAAREELRRRLEVVFGA